MLANDPLGATRERFEDPLPRAYRDAFDAINSDPANELVVAEKEGAVVGVLQLTIIRISPMKGDAGPLSKGCAWLRAAGDTGSDRP